MISLGYSELQSYTENQVKSATTTHISALSLEMYDFFSPRATMYGCAGGALHKCSISKKYHLYHKYWLLGYLLHAFSGRSQ